MTSEMVDNIFCDKCENGLKKLDFNSIDLVITSPPYDELRTYYGFELMIEGKRQIRLT